MIFIEIPHRLSPTVYENDICLTSEGDKNELSYFFEFETAIEAGEYLASNGFYKALDKIRAFLTDEEWDAIQETLFGKVKL